MHILNFYTIYKTYTSICFYTIIEYILLYIEYIGVCIKEYIHVYIKEYREVYIKMCTNFVHF